MSRTDALQVTDVATDPTLSPQHKRFNTLVRQIGKARQTLAAWHENIGLYRQSHAQIVQPLRDEATAALRQWAFALDALLDQTGWTKTERETLRELVCEAAGGLLDVGEEDDAELKALFSKHAEVDFDTERQRMLQGMKGLAEAVTGLDLGDDDIRSDAELFRRMEQEMGAQMQAAEAERSARASRRRKTAAQQRREEEAQQATQSLREIYRKLASALHPDREADIAQREAKTALMQKVNQAYAASDLLTLLELQLKIEQVDADHAAHASAQRLKHYNKVLSEQLGELKAEIERTEMAFRLEFGLEPGWNTNPRLLGKLLEEDARQARAGLQQLQSDLRMLSDKAATKRWLKRQRQLMREEADFFPF